MRDYAYLVIRAHGSPLHFSEVAKKIKKMFGREAHVATCHNELIKDSRFVLVGRGLYALREWGYSTGVVKDVVLDILKKHGSLSKDEIIDLVLKERYVKPNTVVVNLQDTKTFKREGNGKYSLV
jgi:DNA-directed RNA polymerase delta subunit